MKSGLAPPKPIIPHVHPTSLHELILLFSDATRHGRTVIGQLLEKHPALAADLNLVRGDLRTMQTAFDDLAERYSNLRRERTRGRR